ncbi:hypothetical protein PIB30_073376 [Stylosanthes scabra]|uniref:Uncharacterized protein n=1 Tax=Stylosanthes scabra TaxID=79078 RepID=A0ABU6RP98_9FABA|nr:hypothetical protein [Stylosanthes scabra]
MVGDSHSVFVETFQESSVCNVTISAERVCSAVSHIGVLYVVLVARDDPYSWVKGKVREIVLLFRDVESIEELGDPSLWVRGGSNVKVEFLPCSVEDRIFHKGEGWEYFYMYTTVLLDLGVRFPFSQFECGVLSQLKYAPSQNSSECMGIHHGF